MKEQNEVNPNESILEDLRSGSMADVLIRALKISGENMIISKTALKVLSALNFKEYPKQEESEQDKIWLELLQTMKPEELFALGEQFDQIHQMIKTLTEKVNKKETPKKGNMLQLQSKTLKKQTVPNNYIANEIQHGGIIGAGQLNIPVLGFGKQAMSNGEIITTSIIATYQPGESVIMGGNDFTEYDRQVQNSICSLWESGEINHIFTPAMVYRAMTSNNTAQPSQQQIDAVTNSIEKQRSIHMKIDASEEIKRRGITDKDGNPVTSFKINSYLLSLTGVEAIAGGKIIDAYLIESEPLLLKYARLTKQLLTIESSLFDIRRIDNIGRICESIANTEARIAIKGYLLRRIEIMKHDIKLNPMKNKQSNRILFDTVFEEVGQTNTSRDTKKRYRNYIMDCLNYWKAKGHIKDYAIVKDGRALRAVDLYL